MAGKLLVTRRLGPRPLSNSKRFTQLAELPLGSDLYLVIAIGTVQHGGFSMPKQYRAGDPIRMRRSRSACKCTGRRNRSANRRRSIRRGRDSFALARGRSGV
jgi:hypothetical protein